MLIRWVIYPIAELFLQGDTILTEFKFEKVLYVTLKGISDHDTFQM